MVVPKQRKWIIETHSTRFKFLAHIIFLLLLLFFGLNFDTAKRFLWTFLDQRKRVYPKKSLTSQKNTTYFSLASQQLKFNSLTLSFSANFRSFSKNHGEISLIFYFSFTSLLKLFDFEKLFPSTNFFFSH